MKGSGSATLMGPGRRGGEKEAREDDSRQGRWQYRSSAGNGG